MSISYLTPSFLDILIQEFIKLRKNLSDKKLLDNSTYKKLSILSNKMLSFKEVVDARKKKLKDAGDKYWNEPWKIRWNKLSSDWKQCTFPRRGYPMEKDSKWRSKDDTGLKFFVRNWASEGFEKGAIMIKNPKKWHDWQLKALYIMYPDHKDVMPVLVKKHLADWGIPSSPLERGDMANKQEAFINHLIRTVENDQPSFERMDSSISGGESKNQTKTRTKMSMLDREQAALIAKLVAEPTGGESKNQSIEEDKEEPVETIDTLLAEQKNINLHICYLKNKVDEWQEKERKVTEKIKKKQKEQKKERKEKRRKKITELAAELERLKRLNEEDEDSSDEELEEIEVEEPDFPGVDSVEGWSHEALEQWDDVDFYIDEENNIWDENMEFVGTYHGWNDTISFKEDYEPEE